MDSKWLLTILIFVGLVAGVTVGQLLFDDSFRITMSDSEHAHATAVGVFYFLGLLKMLIIPLIATSVIVGVTSVGDFRELGRVGSITLIYYLTTMVQLGTVHLPNWGQPPIPNHPITKLANCGQPPIPNHPITKLANCGQPPIPNGNYPTQWGQPNWDSHLLYASWAAIFRSPDVMRPRVGQHGGVSNEHHVGRGYGSPRPVLALLERATVGA